MTVTLCRDCLSPFSAEPEACPKCGSRRLVSHPLLSTLTIAHIDCDAFYASVEKRDNPELRDKPLIVGHPGGRGVVTTACYIARQYGPRSAMPMFKALELCPQAVVIPPNMAKYQKVGRQIRSVFLSFTPSVEPVSIDEAYLDLSPEVRLKAQPAARSLGEIALTVEREVGVTVSVGLAANKFLAKMASDLDKPRGFSIIGPAEAEKFLAPLPVRKIHGVGEATAKRMAEGGTTTIGQLQTMSEMQLVTQWGKFGRRLALYAHGEDDRKVTPHRPAKSVSAETTFKSDIRNPQQLCEALRPLCDRVVERLVRNHMAGGTLVLKLKTADFQVLTRNHGLPNPTQKAEVLFRHAVPLVEKETGARAFRLIGVGVSDLCSATHADPPDLFGGLV